MTEVFDVYSREQVDTLLAEVAGGGTGGGTGGGGTGGGTTSATGAVQNVRLYGATGDGVTDDTAAFKAAMSAANASLLNKVVYVPPGTYLITPSSYNLTYDSLTLYDGTSLIGDGYSSVLKMKPTVYTPAGNNSHYQIIRYQSNTRLANFRIDGAKAQVNKTGLSNSGCMAINADTQTASNVVFDTLWIHDLYATLPDWESFGIQTYDQNSKLYFRFINGWNLEGTSINTDGDFTTGNMVNELEIIGCRGWNNSWQGISLFKCKNVRIYDSHFYNNSWHGINLEWCYDIDLHNCKVHDNGQAGIGAWANVSYRAHHCTIYNNNSATSGNAEIRVRTGLMSGLGSRRDNADTIEIIDCNVTPTPGGTHLYYEEDPTVTNGPSVPTSISVATEDAHTWTYRSNLGGNILPTGLRVSGRRAIGRIRTASLTQWGTGGIGVSSYTGSDRTSTDAVTLTSTNQFDNAFSAMVLKPTRRYLITVRAKINDTKRWQFGPARIASFGGDFDAEYLQFPKTAGHDVGQWFTTSYVANMAGNDHRLQFMCLDTGGSTLTIDYVTVMELPSTGESFARFDQQGEAAIFWRSSVPTSGTWTVPSVIYNSAPSAGGTVGWVVTSAGTAGTYSEGRTAATTSGSPNATLSSASTVLKPGDYLTINGQSKRVVSISGTAMAMESNFSSSGSGFAISYTAPVFKTFGAISA